MMQVLHADARVPGARPFSLTQPARVRIPGTIGPSHFQSSENAEVYQASGPRTAARQVELAKRV